MATWVGDMQRAHPEWGDGPGQTVACEPSPPLGPYNNTGDGSGGIRFEFVRDLQRWAPFPRVRCPTVLVHGLNDAEVDVGVSLDWVRSYARSGTPVSMHVLADVDAAQPIDHGLYHFAKSDAETLPSYKQILQQHFGGGSLS